jgi:transcriptional regulator with XRE-family HTH domain
MKQQLRKEIGMRLREIRKALGYTQVKMVSFFLRLAGPIIPG